MIHGQKEEPTNLLMVALGVMRQKVNIFLTAGLTINNLNQKKKLSFCNQSE